MKELLKQLDFIFSQDNFKEKININGLGIICEKNGDSITIQKLSKANSFKDYIESIDQDIFTEVCEQYEKLTGKSLKDLDKKLTSDSLEDEDIDEYKAVVKAVAAYKARKLIEDYDLEDLI